MKLLTRDLHRGGVLLKGDGDVEGLYVSGGIARFDLAESDDRSRVSEIVGRLLQVRNLGLLIGSGASFHLGSPKIRSVTRAKVGEMIAGTGINVSADADLLLDALLTGPSDLERVLQMLTAAISYVDAFGVNDFSLGDETFTSSQLDETYSALNVALAHSCDLPGPSAEPEVLRPHQEFFRKMLGARRTDLPRLRIFTTNYDLAIEKSLDGIGVQYLDGFRGGITRRFDLSSFGSDVFSSATTSSGSLLRVHELVHLYKLHGSLNWRRAEESGALMSSGIVQNAEAASKEDLAIIYPTPAKDSDVLGFPYSDLLRIFGSSLAEPEAALIVAGYGFADDHINRLVGQALRHNPTMQLLVLDPVGVVAGDATKSEPNCQDSVTGQLAGVQDGRVAVITGERSAFAVVHELLPDVSPEQPPGRVDAASILAS